MKDTFSKRSLNGSCSICSSAASKVAAVWILCNPVDLKLSGALRPGSGGRVLPIACISGSWISEPPKEDKSGGGVTFGCFSPAVRDFKLPGKLCCGDGVLVK